jgi:hypothetical protein
LILYRELSLNAAEVSISDIQLMLGSAAGQDQYGGDADAQGGDSVHVEPF